MSYSRRRKVRDDLIDVVIDAWRASAPPGSDEAALRAQAEREAARQAAREARNRERERRSFRSLAGVGAGLLAGGLASTMMITPAAVGVGLLVGAVTNWGVGELQRGGFQIRLPKFERLRLEPPRSIDPPEVNGRDLAKSQKDLIQGVLDDVAEEMRKLDAVRQDLEKTDPASAESCRRIIASAEKLSDAVADEPAKFEIARRTLTHYAPKSVYVANAIAARDGEDAAERARNARHTLARIEMAFEKAIIDMNGVNDAEMDLELRMINEALDEDLNTGRPATGTPPSGTA